MSESSISNLEKQFLYCLLTYKTTMMDGRLILTEGRGRSQLQKSPKELWVAIITNISKVQRCEAEKGPKWTTVTPGKALWLKWSVPRLIWCKQAILHLMNANTKDSLCACSSLIHLLWRIIMSNTWGWGVWTWDQTAPQTQKEKRKTSNL